MATLPQSLPRMAILLCWLFGMSRASLAEDPWYRSYEKGVAAVEAGDWDEAARLLTLAMADGPAPGRNLRTYGVRFVDFLPGYYLAVAQYNLGQYQQAVEQLDDVFSNRVLKEGDEPLARDPVERREVSAA